MNTSENNFDALEQVIFNEDLRITGIDFHTEQDLMLIILNTKAVLHQKISAYPGFQDATIGSLHNYQIIAEGTGVHWPNLDEDLSLKGFLQEELRNLVKAKAA